MSSFRLKKVESLLQKEIGLIILNGKVKDPRIDSFLTVSKVKVSKDLAYAKIFISSFKTETSLTKAVDALNHAAGFIQSLLNRHLKMRYTPRLNFVADTSIKEGFEMIRKLEEMEF
jgi:ribosome-binding factor A